MLSCGSRSPNNILLKCREIKTKARRLGDQSNGVRCSLWVFRLGLALILSRGERANIFLRELKVNLLLHAL